MPEFKHTRITNCLKQELLESYFFPPTNLSTSYCNDAPVDPILSNGNSFGSTVSVEFSDNKDGGPGICRNTSCPYNTGR